MKNDSSLIFLRLANTLTLGRLLAVPVVVFLLVRSTRYPEYETLALIVLVLLQASDVLDGFLARCARPDAKTRNIFGQIMDPVADKLYINSTYLTLSLTRDLPWWVTLIVLSRDLLIGVGWSLRALLKNDMSVQPHFWGKVADTCQAFLIFAFLLHVPTRFLTVGEVVTVLLTIFSGAVYLLEEKNLLHRTR